MKQFRFETHRGVVTEYPENTMPAIRAAVEQGYDMVEFDLRFTSDGRCVLLHDRSVGRTARRSDGGEAENLPIAEMTFDAARALDFGLHKGEAFRGTRIPALEELCEFAEKNPIFLKIDNVFETYPTAQRQRMYEILASYDLGEKVGFTCAHPETFDEVRKLFPRCEMHYDGKLDRAELDAVAAYAKGHRLTVWTPAPNGYAYWVKDIRTTPEFCDHLHTFGDVGLWLIRTEEELRQAQEIYHADIIETDGSIKPRK